MLRLMRLMAELFPRLLLREDLLREEDFELFFRAMGLKPKYCSNYSMREKLGKSVISTFGAITTMPEFP